MIFKSDNMNVSEPRIIEQQRDIYNRGQAIPSININDTPSRSSNIFFMRGPNYMNSYMYMDPVLLNENQN